MSEPQSTPTDNPSPDALLTAGVPYICRSCGNEMTIYVLVEPTDDEPRTVELPRPHNVRLEHRHCDECDTERTFVIAVELADEPRECAPIAHDEVGV